MDPTSSSLFVTRVVVCLGLLRPVAVLMVPVLARYRSRLDLLMVPVAARLLPRAAAAWPSPCSLYVGCAGFNAGGRHVVARGGTCAASDDGGSVIAVLALRGLRWLQRWRSPRCGAMRKCGTCAASIGGGLAVAVLALCGLRWHLRWRSQRCGANPFYDEDGWSGLVEPLGGRGGGRRAAHLPGRALPSEGATCYRQHGRSFQGGAWLCTGAGYGGRRDSSRIPRSCWRARVRSPMARLPIGIRRLLFSAA